MYFQKIFNIVLQESSEEPIIKPQKQNKNKNANNVPPVSVPTSTPVTSDELKRAYALFSTDGQSFLSMFENKKITVFLNGIEHPDKYDQNSKNANKFINDHIKKKNVFLNIIEVLEDGNILADVFLDNKKEESLNSMLIDLNLHKSLDIKDEQALQSSGIEVPEVKPTPEPKVEKKNTANTLIGYLKNHGHAPYLNKPGNKDSYFITLETEEGIITKWGVDFERAITSSDVRIEDFIKISKTGTSLTEFNKKLNFWEITHLEDVHTIAANGAPINYEDNVNNEDKDNAYEEPDDWANSHELLDENSHRDIDTVPESDLNQNSNIEEDNKAPVEYSSGIPEDNWEPDWNSEPDTSGQGFMPPEPPPEEGYTSVKKPGF